MQTSRPLLPRCSPCPRHLPPNYHLFTIFRRNVSDNGSDRPVPPVIIRTHFNTPPRLSKRANQVSNRFEPARVNLRGQTRAWRVGDGKEDAGEIGRPDGHISQNNSGQNDLRHLLGRRVAREEHGARTGKAAGDRGREEQRGIKVKIYEPRSKGAGLGTTFNKAREARLNARRGHTVKKKDISRDACRLKRLPAADAQGLVNWDERKEAESVPVVEAEDKTSKTGFRAASLLNNAGRTSRPLKIGSFWTKLRDLSSAKPRKSEEVQAEVQEADEKEVEEDLEVAKGLAEKRSGQKVRDSAVKTQTRPEPHCQEVISPDSQSEVPSRHASESLKEVQPAPIARPQSTSFPPTPSPFDALPAMPRPQGKRATDLLTLLFPDSVRPTPTPVTPVRPISRIPFTPTITSLLSAVSAHEARLTGTASERAAVKQQEEQRQRWRRAIRGDVGVLVLRKASRNLEFDDFACVAPGVGTKHLSGWGGSGDIVRVIRARDTVTFDAKTDYFVVFKNEESAKAYHDHVLGLHNYARTFSPVSGAVTERVAGGAARRLRLDPEVLQAQLEAYCLALPGHDLDLRQMRQPFSSLMRKILETGGYAGLVDEDRRVSDWEVLVSLESADLEGLGVHGGLRAVRKALQVDGQTRGVLWNIVGKGQGVREVKAGMSKEESDDDEKVAGRSPPLHRKFVLSFPSEDEAVRFVGSWHRRDVGELMPSVLDQESVVVDAEVVW